MTCQSKAIRAHSIQNARVFDLVSADNHVSMLKARFTKDGPSIIFDEIGRNEASTFPGFCSDHDAAIFRRLDAEPLALADDEQLFLLAYRSVSRELHATMEAAAKIQGAYQDRVERGLDDGDVPTPAGMEALSKMMVSYETYRYRAENFDSALQNQNFTGIEHDVIELQDQPPVVAASCLFSLDEIQIGDDVARAVLNVMPIDQTHTIAIFSYTSRDAALARAALDRIFRAEGVHQMYELSKLMIERMENFVLSPTHLRGWSASKRDAVKAAFLRTLFTNGIEDDAQLMLF